MEKALPQVVLGQFGEDRVKRGAEFIDGDVDGLLYNCLNVLLRSHGLGLIFIKGGLQIEKKIDCICSLRVRCTCGYILVVNASL